MVSGEQQIILIRLLASYSLFPIFLSFADWLGKIQSKPYRERVKIMWACVGVSMVLVFFFWFFSLNHIMKPGGEGETAGSAPLKEVQKNYKEFREEAPSFWRALKASIFGASESVSDQKESVKESPKSIFKENKKENNQEILKLPKN